MSNTNNSSMNSPLFQVGELVGLVSQYDPQSNGQYVIVEIRFGNFINVMTREWVEVNAYVLDGLKGQWGESALRKIHKPSEYSYQELLTSLKQTSKIPSPA